MAISYYDSPIGKLRIEEEDGKIISLDNVFDLSTNEKDDVDEDTDLIKDLKMQLDEYFLGKRKEFNIPIFLNGTVYQEKVWEELMKIPYGRVATYGKIAERIGNKKGARSVGMACGKNKIMILIPCHRVIGASKKLVGFAGGLAAKEKLLLLEDFKDWKK